MSIVKLHKVCGGSVIGIVHLDGPSGQFENWEKKKPVRRPAVVEIFLGEASLWKFGVNEDSRFLPIRWMVRTIIFKRTCFTIALLNTELCN